MKIWSIAIKNAKGNDYTGDIYAKGSTKTLYAYTALEKTLYSAGTKQTVQGYSAYSSKLYMAGTAVDKIGTAHTSETYYKGNGSSGYLAGSGATVLTGYYKYSGALYDADGERVNGSSTFYYGGSEKTRYTRSSTYVTDRGDSVSAIKYSGTLYEKGSSVTPASTQVTGLYVTDDEANWSYTPIGTAYSGLYQRNAEDDATVVTVGDKCSLNPATLTTEEIVALTV